MLECPGYGDEESSTVGHTVELSESVCLVIIVELGVSGLSNRSYCSVAGGISSTGDIYEPVYPAIGHIAGMSRLR